MSHKFSILIRAAGTNNSFFRDCIESVIAQTDVNLELVVLDENDSQEVRFTCEEMFAGDEIDNDLKMVDDTIREYYNLSNKNNEKEIA